MKLSYIVRLLYVGAAAVSALSQNATFVAQEIAKIPSCGLTCLAQTVPIVGCSLLNTTCQCSSQNLVLITANCMLANCTVAESLQLSKIQAAICGLPQESRNEQIRNIIIIGASITYPAIVLRFISRYILSQKFGFDDWFIFAALFSDIIFTVFGILLQRHGFGEHVWMIDASTVQQLLNWFFICEFFYILNIALIKTSIIFFYLRVFPSRSFRTRCWIVIAFCVTSGIAFTFAVLFQCYPISYAWNTDQKGTCTNYNAVSWANAGVNILQDILIVFLPIPELQILQLSTRKKLGVYAMFGLGLIVCVASIIRLWSLQTFGLKADPTWDNVPTTFWSIIETTTAVTCACMPPIRGGLQHILSKSQQSTVMNPSSPCSKISIRLASSSPTRKYWASRESSSKSSLNRTEEEPFSQNRTKIIDQKQECRNVSSLDPKTDLSKPLPIPGSRPRHVASLMK